MNFQMFYSHCEKAIVFLLWLKGKMETVRLNKNQEISLSVPTNGGVVIVSGSRCRKTPPPFPAKAGASVQKAGALHAKGRLECKQT